MIPVEHSLTNFVEHLERNISITCSKAGWKADGVLQRFKKKIHQMFHGNKDAYLESMGRCFLSAMDHLEHSPVQFQSVRQEYYADYLKAAKLVKHLLKPSMSSKVHKRLNELAIKVAALKYRMEACNGGLDPALQIDEVLQRQATDAALEWKKSQKLYFEHHLSERDLKKIQEVCAYPKFAKLLVKDNQLSQEFFKWALRDNNGVGQFVQFPGICQRLKEAYIAPRLAHFAGEALTIAKIPKENTVLKVLELPFYNGTQTERISILDESRKVTLNEGWSLPIKQIFDVFANKNKEPGNVEFLGMKGIMNWNSRKLAPWNPQTKSFSLIDFNHTEWIERLPLSEVKSREEINKNYGISKKNWEWLFVYRSSRDEADLSIGGRHSFLEVVKPMKDGNFAIYPFGIYPDDFPAGLFASIAFINKTSRGRVVYPDDSINYTMRQHAIVPNEISSQEGLKLLNCVRQDLQKSRSENIIFQSRRENCSYWVQNISEKIEGCKALNPYKIKIIQSNTFAAIGKLPKRYQSICISVIDILLGAHRGLTVSENGKKVFKSVRLMPPQEKMFMYQPGWLYEQIKSGKLPGRIYFGHR